MTKEQIDNIFTYHAPFGDQTTRYQELRAKGGELALLINDSCPESKEKSLAFTQLQSAIHWANAAIAINEINVDKVPLIPAFDDSFDTTTFS